MPPSKRHRKYLANYRFLVVTTRSEPPLVVAMDSWAVTGGSAASELA